jgi:hypothetical protein
MSIVDDFQAIAARANRDLDAVHDFFEHSKLVWRSFRDSVDAGKRISAENSATGTKIDETGLLALAPRYARAYLATFTFRQFVSDFESFFFAFFHRVLQHNPWQFAQSQLTLKAVLEAKDRDEIIAAVILKQLNEVKYEKVRDWFGALNKAIELGCPADEEIAALAEAKASRAILEHNLGIANDVYVRKAGKKARAAAGEPIEIDDTYHLESWRLLKKVIADLTAAGAAKLGTP